MSARPIALPGYRFDKSGKLVRGNRRQSVSDKIKARKSKRARVIRRTASP